MCLNSSMQIKAVIDFSWIGYLSPIGNLPVLTGTSAINFLGLKNKKQRTMKLYMGQKTDNTKFYKIDLQDSFCP